MTRQTHDRLHDHFGTDLDTDSVLSADLPDPVLTAAGQTVRQGLLDIISNVGAAAGLTDLLLGQSKSFTGGIGAWVASGAGSTIAYDGAVGINGNGSAKFHATTDATSRYAQVAVAGTFKAGQLYHARLIVHNTAITGVDQVTYRVFVGDIGASDTGAIVDLRFAGPDFTDWTAPSDETVAVLAYWTPSADRTSVTLNLTRNAGTGLTTDLWIEEARVVAVPGNSIGLAGGVLVKGNGLPVMPITEFGRGSGLILLDRHGGRYGVRVLSDGVELDGPVDALDDNSEFKMTAARGIYLHGNQQTAPARRAQAGFDLEVGPDYVGVYVSERSSSVVEMEPDGSYDVVLVDGGSNGDTTHHWKTENADGTLSSNLAKLHNILTGTADPTAGGGVAHPQPAMYLRDNSGTTEIWTSTGTGATAWQKVTIP